ncbi:MAG: hypothetical protein DI534_02520 [Leifsonia xyli]|nr:MAG: hypothetical protein DI534_02520 [Leifsonia xyli]
MVWRLAWISAIGGLLLALVLALLGVAAASGGGELMTSLLPAVVLIGLGMAVPPWLFGVAGLAVSIARRGMRREAVATAIGGAVGAFVSPIVFYPASAQLGLTVALVIVVAASGGYPLAVRGLWRQSSRPERHPRLG